jgi:hypothetical protein
LKLILFGKMFHIYSVQKVTGLPKRLLICSHSLNSFIHTFCLTFMFFFYYCLFTYLCSRPACFELICMIQLLHVAFLLHFILYPLSLYFLHFTLDCLYIVFSKFTLCCFHLLHCIAFSNSSFITKFGHLCS